MGLHRDGKDTCYQGWEGIGLDYEAPPIWGIEGVPVLS